MTVTRALAAAAARHADRPAILAGDLRLSHAQLDACVSRAAAALAGQGVAPGDLIGISLPSGPLHLVTLLAIARAGAWTAHLHPALPGRVRQAMAGRYGVKTGIGVVGAGLPLQADPQWLEPGNAPAPAERAGPRDPWRLAMSSGTTGVPKAIRFTHEQTLDYLDIHDRAAPMSPSERYLCHRGMDSNLALNTVLCHLRAGGAVVFPASFELEHFIEAVERHAVTQLTLSPAFLRDLATALPPGGPRFPSLRLVRVAGSSLPPPLFELASERVTPNLATVYGLFEIGFVTMAAADVLRSAPGSVGRVVEGVEVVLADERDLPAPAGAPGLLRVRRKGMPQEYYRNPEASAKSFRGGWFHTGDLATFDAAGLLHIGGRSDDRLNLDGQKIEPEPIERALETHPAVAEAAVFAASPRGRAVLYAAVVLRAPASPQDLIAYCSGRVGAGYAPKQLFPVDRLPRNEAGKLVRASLSRRVRPKRD